MGRESCCLPALSGAVFAALHASYACARLGEVTITSRIVQFGPLALVGTFLVTGAGAFLFLSSKSWRARALAVALGTMPVWVAMCFSLAAITTVNVFIFRPELGTGAYNYALVLLPIGTLAVESLLLLGWFSLLQRFVTSRGRMQGLQTVSMIGRETGDLT
jgi:hypothetical protein